MADVLPDSGETQSLLQHARTGDRRAFEQLFARHRPYLRQLIELRLDPKLRSRVDAFSWGVTVCLKKVGLYCPALIRSSSTVNSAPYPLR